MILLATVTLGGCTTIQVSQDYDPRADLWRYDSWQWRDPVQAPTGDIRIDNPLLDKRIRLAVGNHLAGRNINLAQEQPDLYLAYHLAINQKILSDTYYPAMGMGSYYYPWYGGFATETRIRQYDESRLTIDIFAADTGNLLWRGVGTYRLKNHKTPRQAAAETQQAVDKILSQFPPAWPD
jgi:hypothetical protein